MRIAPAIVLTNKEHRKLLALSRARRQPMRLVQRAKIVLLAAKGLENREIAQRLGVGNDLVSRWRRRYLAARLAGIEKDAPRPGRTASIAPELIEKIVRKTTQEKPLDATHWSQRTMAKAVGVSPATVARAWRRHGLRPPPRRDLQAQQGSAIHGEAHGRRGVVSQSARTRHRIVR